MRYLEGTLDIGLVNGKRSINVISVNNNVDVDYAKDFDKRRS